MSAPEERDATQSGPMPERFDLVELGSGSAARDAAKTAARDHGARVALIERERWGGSCPNVACTPTKAYLVAAELAHDVNHLAARIGVDTGATEVVQGFSLGLRLGTRPSARA